MDAHGGGPETVEVDARVGDEGGDVHPPTLEPQTPWILTRVTHIIVPSVCLLFSAQSTILFLPI